MLWVGKIAHGLIGRGTETNEERQGIEIHYLHLSHGVRVLLDPLLHLRIIRLLEQVPTIILNIFLSNDTKILDYIELKLYVY